MHAMLPRLNHRTSDFPSLRRGRLETLQVNMGYRCNQQCQHCHVNAGPNRKEIMTDDTVNDLIAFMARSRVAHLDLTGGAPEIHPGFRKLVRAARALGMRITDRCNLTVLSEPGQEDLAHFLADMQVEIVASMPCYLEENVNAQRGKGVFAASIEGLRKLNALGYAAPDSERVLNLMYNPAGAFLPPPQAALEADYRQRLQADYGVQFNQLHTLVNMPIQRFGSMLVSKGEFDGYMALLRSSYGPDNLDKVMCRSLISVDWQGDVYDCDFNQMLGMPLTDAACQQERIQIRDLDPNTLAGLPIAVADHCYGCTAGQGSSCGGALSTGSEG